MSISVHLFIGASAVIILGGGFFGCGGNSVAIWTSNRKFTSLSYVDLFFLSGVQDLKDILSKLLAWSILEVSRLKEHLDVSEFAEVEVTFFVERVILKFELLKLSLELSISSSSGSSSTTDGLTSWC